VARLSTWRRRLLGAIRVALACLVVIVVIAAVVGYLAMLPEVGREATRNDSLSFLDREIAGGNSVVADQAAVYAARALIPVDQTYHVAVSPSYAGGSDLTREHVAGYYRYFLMPRRPAEGAPWVVCYGCDLEAYGAAAQVVWRGDEDISIVRVLS
jgi:hypothetical protein